MRANMGFEAVGVMSCHVSFQIISSGKSWTTMSKESGNNEQELTSRTSWTLVFLARIFLGLIFDTTD